LITRICEDLDREIDTLLGQGYRLDMIMPADSPVLAYVSKGDEKLQLKVTPNPKSQIPHPKSRGRAGMEYRDLIPGRLGGFLIASHIRITEGGDVADYIHYHKLRFQMIYCKAGWIRVVYEDQGPPFLMQPGDCILQPPEIRHRVLEASAGAEVIELSSPAVHETWVDHEMELPTPVADPGREFDGQRFVRHVAAEATWENDAACEYRDTGISKSTGGRASVRVVRIPKGATMSLAARPISFIYVLTGELVGGDITLETNSSFVTPDDTRRTTALTALAETEVLHVALSEEMTHLFFATSVPTDFEP
jgi:quercetin dioxygenase-like cupin family protein